MARRVATIAGVAEIEMHLRYPESGSFMKIEVLYIDGCPHFPPTVDAVKKALGQYGLNSPVIETMVRDQERAVKIGFLGSPMVRINSLDIEPSARHRTAFGMMCPTYEGSSGVPSEDLIRQAITQAATASSTSPGTASGVSLPLFVIRRKPVVTDSDASGCSHFPGPSCPG